MLYTPQPGDAYVELECSLTVGGGATGKRDNLRDLEFAAAIKQWETQEPGRSLKGAQLRYDEDSFGRPHQCARTKRARNAPQKRMKCTCVKIYVRTHVFKMRASRTVRDRARTLT